MPSFSQHPQQARGRRPRRSTASAVATTVAAAYGTYRLAKWYWREDEEIQAEEGIERPLEEDLPSVFAEERTHDAGDETRNQNRGQSSCNQRPENISSNKSGSSWLSTAAVGLVGWFTDVGDASPVPRSGPGNHSGYCFDTTISSSSDRSSLRPQPTRRQQLMRCRCQSRVAFQTCFQTLKPVLERLTDSSRQTKELKASRRRRQALKEQRKGQQQSQPQLQPLEEQENGRSNGDACTNSFAKDEKQQERELRMLEEREEELWREILLETTTRMMASSYAYTLLLLSLTVQFHWLASMSASASASDFPPNSTEEQHQQEQQREQEALLMQSHRYFLDEGIPLLVSTVRRSMERVLFGDDETDEEEESLGRTPTTNNKNNHKPSSRWRNPSSQFVSSGDIEESLYRKLPRVLDDLRLGGNQRFRSRRRRNWIRFVLPDEEVFDPVWDICRSPIWEDAQEQVLGYLWYKILRDGESNNPNECNNSHGWGKVFQTNGTPDGKNHQKQQQGQQQPLAKAMAHFKKASSSLFEDVSSSEDDGGTSGLRGETRRTTMAGRLQTLPSVLELGDITFQ